MRFASTREALSSYSPVISDSLSQLQLDALSESLAAQATHGQQLFAMSLGSFAYQLGRMSCISLGVHPLFSAALGLGLEAATFGGVNHALTKPEMRGSFFEDWRRDVLHFGLLKSFGNALVTQNAFLRHGVQALGMAAGGHLTAHLGWTPEEASWSQSLVQGLAMSVALEAGQGAFGRATGQRLNTLQRSLESRARSLEFTSAESSPKNIVSLASPVGLQRTELRDVTGLQRMQIQGLVVPQSVEAVQEIVRTQPGPISIAGGRYSMGGQIACENALVIDLKGFNQVLHFQPTERRITVQSGITWRQLLEVIDPHDLSIQVMQSYSNFSVGGSLSVNAHGRYMGAGPVVSSVHSIRVVLADGTCVEASREQNPEIFFGCIGGYGALGVIVEATLNLSENRTLERVDRRLQTQDYPRHFAAELRGREEVVLHNADLLPPHYDAAVSVTWRETRRHPTVNERMIARERKYVAAPAMVRLMSDLPGAGVIRGMVEGRLLVGSSPVFGQRPVARRNYEASHDVAELGNISGHDHAYVLQEYFVPEGRFDEFVPRMREIFQRYQVNVVNVSVRHAKADPDTLLSWARKDSFCFVLYYKQGMGEVEKGRVGLWTRELIDAATSLEGSYYLPYQIQATREQFRRAYPRSGEFWALKARLDPQNKFRNALLDAYRDTEVSHEPLRDSSVFRRVYLDAKWKDQFFLFLQNIYRLYPEDRFHELISELTASGRSDREIYEALQARLPAIRPALADLTYAIPSLVKQKDVMVGQTVTMLGESARREVNGYLEIGTKGRYVAGLRERLRMKGPLYLMNEQEMGFAPVDILERGQVQRLDAESLSLDNYRGISERDIPTESLDLATCYIGLHHAPEARLDEFVRSLHRTLRPGGKFIIRDHNVHSDGMRDLVNLVHDVFNAGIQIPWAETQRELRNFRSVQDWIGYLEARGFRFTGKRALQDHDPTLNTLLEFEKVAETRLENAEGTREAEASQAVGASREASAIALPAGYRRAEENTFLTFPEWYIVYMSQEYAAFLASGKPPSQFPHLNSIRHFWSAYGAILSATHGRYPFNWGEHACEGILGASISAEFGARALYEGSVGRLTEMLGGHDTPEDRFARDWNQRYASFIPDYQFYLYNYLAELERFWREVPLQRQGGIRGLERRLILSAELGFKAFYGKAVDKAFFAMYGRDGREIFARVQAPAQVFESTPRLRRLFDDAEGSSVVALPRYQEFTNLVPGLLEQGLQFYDIAGNQTILITAIAHKAWRPRLQQGEMVFSLDMLMDASSQRVGLALPVSSLHEVLPALARQGVHLEHIYEY